jgi:hypothetical protein
MEVVYSFRRQFPVETFNKFRVLQRRQEKDIEPPRGLPALLSHHAFLKSRRTLSGTGFSLFAFEWHSDSDESQRKTG